jgi:hypothetical protein
MTQIISATGIATSTRYGKRAIALSMYGKGKAFIGSYLLLKQKASDEPAQYVALNLLAQGVEVTLKAFLLYQDYDKYRPKLQKRLGHDLVKTTRVALNAFTLKPLREPLGGELAKLSEVYSKHMLRYGNLGDIFVAPSTIPSDRVLRRIAAAIRLAERELKRAR